MATFSKHVSWIALVGMFVCNPSGLCAAEKAKDAAAVKPGKTAAVAAEWIAKLNSPKYQTRVEATKQLHALGKAAIDPIAKAAETDDLELAARCLSILKSFYDSKDPATKAASQRALKRLEKSSHATVAKRAADATRKPAPVPVPNRFGNRVIIANGNARVQIQLQRMQQLANRAGRRAAARQISREATAKENGKTIHVKESLIPNREVVVKVTEKVNGKDKITEYKASTSAELRRKQPKAYALYKKLIVNAGVRFQARNVNVPPRVAAVLRPPGANPPPGNPPRAVPPGRFGARAGNITVRSSNANGQRVIDINDGSKTIRITDENGTNIAMKVTETVGGKQKTTEYKAKNVAELKKKHPAAAKIYEQYAKDGNLRLQMLRNRFGNRFGRQPNLPQIPGRFGRAGGAQNQTAKKEIEKANERLANAIKQLKKLTADKNAKPEDLKKVTEEIQYARDALERAFTALK